jgi:hypothetical protein
MNPLKRDIVPARYIRIRRNMSSNWVWELVTADGHVAQESQQFMSRADCETEAVRQDLPVRGLHVVRKSRKPSAHEMLNPVLRLIRDRPAGLWCWQLLNKDGQELEMSTRAFLTRDECVADARDNGHLQ